VPDPNLCTAARDWRPPQPFPGEIGKALRVSRYFPDADEPGHVRFSVVERRVSGCYGLQIDGTSFSGVIVIRVHA
jgi:hypothetical protein